jgi:hypothetical protein
MALNVTTLPGKVFVQGTPFTTDDLNLAARPTVSFSGSVAGSDIDNGAITPAKSTPGAYWFATTTGTSTTYALDLTPSLTALTSGALISGKFHTANTAASTLSVDGLTAKSILGPGGRSLRPGDLNTNYTYHLIYVDNGSSQWWELLNPSNPEIRRGIDNSSTATTIKFTTVPPLTALYDGARVSARMPVDNDANATLQIDSTTAKVIQKLAGTALIDDELLTGQDVLFVYDSTADRWRIETPSSYAPSFGFGGVRGLSVSSGSVTQVSATADEAVLIHGTTGAILRVTSVNVTAAITSSGANGLDTGVEAGNTWYYLWLIHNGTTLASLLSASSTAPTMPSGYVYKLRVGAVRNDGSSNFTHLQEHGDKVLFKSALTAWPGSDSNVEVSHGLSGVPSYFSVVLRCNSTELGYAAGDEVDIQSLGDGVDLTTDPPVAYASSSVVGCGLYFNSRAYKIWNRSSPGWSNIATGKWDIKFYAEL